MECRIFLASLTAHTNGMIDGEWIDLTDNNAMDKIDAFMDEREGHKFFISDSSTSVAMDIGEYDDPYELVEFVERLEDLDETQLDAFDAMVTGLRLDREDALDKAESWEFDVIEWDWESIEESVGYYYAELNGYTNMADDTIRKYFNYEAYGRDICIESDVCDNGKTIFVIHQKRRMQHERQQEQHRDGYICE